MAISCVGSGARPSIVIRRWAFDGTVGMLDAVAARLTPGTRRAASISRSANIKRASGVG